MVLPTILPCLLLHRAASAKTFLIFEKISDFY